LAVVDDRIGKELGDDAVDEVAVLDRADVGGDPLAGELLPGRDPGVEVGDRGQRVGARALDPAPSVEVVDDRDLVPARRETKCRRPAEVAVATENEDPNRPARLGESGRCQIAWWPETAAD
jgi:hypothetical protein